MSERLALLGGSPVVTTPWPTWPQYGKAEEDALLRVLHSGHWGRLGGTEADAFEREFADFQEARFGIGVPCGTTALVLALLATGIQAGDEVIVPPYTFIASVGAILQCNAVPVFVDIHPDSYCLDPDRVEEAITPRTKAIIAVHLGGQPADLDRLIPLAQRHGLTLIEDASHAHGTVYRGRKVGALGTVGTFSFQASKNLNSGEGGIVLTNDETLATALRGESDWGCQRGQPRVGSNFRMTEFQAALLRAQLGPLPEQTARRDRNGKRLNTLLGAVPGLRPLPREALGCDVNAYHLYVFRYEEAVWGVPRTRFLKALAAEGVPSGPGYTHPIYDWPVFVERQFGPYSASRADYASAEAARKRCPVMERVAKKEGCWLRQSMLLAEPEVIEAVGAAAQKVWENREQLCEPA